MPLAAQVCPLFPTAPGAVPPSEQGPLLCSLLGTGPSASLLVLPVPAVWISPSLGTWTP